MGTLCIIRAVRESHPWDMFALSLTWPVTLCKFNELRKAHHNCSLSSEFWTIHGLWPNTKTGKDFPKNCKISRPFDEVEIKRLLGTLEKYWPNQFQDTGKYTLWRNEWEKHGRCATIVKETGNELLYFNKTLSLRMKYDIDIMFSNVDIEPGKTYEVQVKLLTNDVNQGNASKDVC